MALLDDLAGVLAGATSQTSGAWYDQLLPASWRDVPFQLDSSEETFGNATVLREYPFADLPTVFAMGKAANEIRVSAYVIGPDYRDQRDRLREALEQTDDGVFVHPTYGAQRVWVHGKPTLKEAPVSEGGVARFDITFVRAEPRRYPVAPAASSDALFSVADVANAAAAAQFAANFSLTGLAGWARDSVGALLGDMQDQVWAVVSGYAAGFSFFNELSVLYHSTAAQLTDLARNPAQLAQHFMAFFALPEDLDSGTAKSVYSGLQTLFNAGVDIAETPLTQSPYQTATRIAQARDMQAASLLVRQGATVAAARALAQVELENYDDALAYRSAMNDQISGLLVEMSRLPAPPLATTSVVESTGDTTPPHEAMQQLQTAVLADLQSRSTELARLTTYTPLTWQPVWYISYRLYGTIQWAEEIRAMNASIRHPLLAAPGVTLRVVRHD